MVDSSWYSKGYDALKNEEKNHLGLPRYFWVKSGGYKDIVFLTDEPIVIKEHNPKMNGSFDNNMTCLRSALADEIPCCETLGMKSAYLAGYYPAVNCTPYKDKNDVTHQFQLEFFLAKNLTMKALELKLKTVGAFAGKLIRATRLTDKSARCGDNFEIIRPVDMGGLFKNVQFMGKKLTEIYAKAATSPEELAKFRNTFDVPDSDITNGTPAGKLYNFNYMNLLKPMSPKDMRLLLKSSKIEQWDNSSKGSFGGKADTSVDEEVPF